MIVGYMKKKSDLNFILRIGFFFLEKKIFFTLVDSSQIKLQEVRFRKFQLILLIQKVGCLEKKYLEYHFALEFFQSRDTFFFHHPL